jgi:hypothetical protein
VGDAEEGVESGGGTRAGGFGYGMHLRFKV